MNINDLHQLPEDHEVSRRTRVSLAHIDTAALLSKDRERFDQSQKKAASDNRKAATGFEVGQSVRTRRGDRGTVAAIEAGKISIEINGSVRVFAASMIFAA